MNWRLADRTLELSQPLAAGIVNVSADSMFSGARSGTPEQAIADGQELIAAGFEMLDVGAVAARSGPPVAPEAESGALLPAIEGLHGAGVPLSADTFSAEVAGRALEAGAVAINDIGGGSAEMLELVAASGCGYVLMHIEGPPRQDRDRPAYADVVAHLKEWFSERIDEAVGRGVEPRSRSRSTRGSTSTSPPSRTSRSSAAWASCRARPPPVRLALAQGLHRRRAGRLLGGPPPGLRARVGHRSRRLAGGGRRGRDPADPRPQRAASGPGSGQDQDGGRACSALEAPPARSLIETPWAIPLDPARRDGRIVAESVEPERPPRTVALPRSLDPGFADALRAAGVERLYSHQLAALDAAAGTI